MARRSTPAYVSPIRDFLAASEGSAAARQEAIELAVERILGNNQIFMPAVNVTKVAANLNFDIFTAQFSTHEIKGAMADVSENDDRVHSNRFILVEDGCDDFRQSGTIAHELGHFFLHCDGKSDFVEQRPRDIEKVSGRDRPKEEAAENFMRTLLMPKSLLIPFLQSREGQRWEDLFRDIKLAFRVPRHTAKQRLEQLLSLSIPSGGCFEGV